MKKKAIAGGIASGIILIAVASNIIKPKSSNSQKQTNNPTTTATVAKPTIPTCDGTNKTTNCVLDGVNYKTYIYHAAEPEKNHTVQVTTYEKKVTGYCTLCRDDTYSPSCATGRGACSYHGGVAQWNAPEYSSVPVYSNKTVVDSPAIEAFYEKDKQ